MTDEPTVPFKINMPATLRGRIGNVAAKNGRSVTAEIIARLEKSFAADDEHDNALENIDEALARIEELEKMVRSHDEQLNPSRYLAEF